MIVTSVHVGKVGLVVHPATIDDIRKSNSRSCIKFLRHVEIFETSCTKFQIIRAAILSNGDGENDRYWTHNKADVCTPTQAVKHSKSATPK